MVILLVICPVLAVVWQIHESMNPFLSAHWNTGFYVIYTIVGVLAVAILGLLFHLGILAGSSNRFHLIYALITADLFFNCAWTFLCRYPFVYENQFPHVEHAEIVSLMSNHTMNAGAIQLFFLIPFFYGSFLGRKYRSIQS